MDKYTEVILKIKKEGKEVEFYGKRTLKNMMIFILGYTYRRWKDNERDLEFLPEFDEFVLQYYGLKDNTRISQNRMDIIDFFSLTDEESLDEFYKLLEMFLISKGENIYE